jgi:hypothetical protein
MCIRKPASTTQSISASTNISVTRPSVKSRREKAVVSIPMVLVLSKIPAELAAPFEPTQATSANGESMKWRMICSAFEPEPDAKIAMRCLVNLKS